MKILLLGDGLLGSEIVKQTGWDYISRKKNGLNFNDPKTYFGYMEGYDTILNCIGNTDTYSMDKEKHYTTNYKGVAMLATHCDHCFSNKKLIHISTDYVYANSEQFATEDDLPLISENWYSYYKLLADEYVMLRNPNNLVLRCSFKPKPFPYDLAWADQFGNFDYVDVISKIIIELINKNTTGIVNVGTETKTMFDLAKQTNENVKKGYGSNYPQNVTMNLDKMNKILKTK